MKRVISFLVVLLAAAATGKTAQAADACIADGARKAMTECPNTGPQSFKAHGKPAGTQFHSKLEDKRTIKENKPTNPTESQMAGFRDDRKTRLQQRALALLITEIQQLESLYRATGKCSRDRPQLLRRLAEDYVELENAAFREKTQAEIDRDNLKRTNPRAAGEKQTIVNQRTTTMVESRKAGIRHYTTLVTDYSGNPLQGCGNNAPGVYPALDEAYYYLAYEYEQAGDTANARKVYLELISNDHTKGSKYVVNAYLAFGELFFQEAQNDPTKWDASRKAYEEVVKKPPPDNKVYGYALYKLAYVYWNTAEFEKSLSNFQATIDYGQKFSQLPNATKLAESARRDIIPVYALSKRPAADSYNYFKNLSGDSGSNEKTFKMMYELGVNYIDTGHYTHAVELFKDLLVRDSSGDKTCIYQSHISEAVMAAKSGDKTAIIAELDKQQKRLQQYKSENHSPEGKLECANKTASLLAETAMAWHLEAVGSNNQRGTGDGRTMDASSALYKKVAESFSSDEFSKFTFPKLVKEDWPTLYKIKYNMADLLYFREKWKECGPAFDAVVAENPAGAEAAEAAYAAVLCYQNVYLAEHAKGSDRRGSGNLPGVGRKIEQDDSAMYKAKEMTESQKGMAAAFRRYVCYIKPEAKDTEGQKQLVEVKYAEARTYFDARRWDEAALAFRDVAVSHPESELAPYAAQLYLESINVLTFKGEPKRPACLDDMVADVPRFIDSFCTGDKAARTPEICTTLAKVQCDIGRLKYQRMVEDADKGPANALELYEKAGKGYFDLWEKYGKASIEAGKVPQCEKLEEIVYNSARAFQAGRLIASAIKARMVLLNPAFHMDQTELAKDAMYEIGGNWQAIAVYDQAAEWYERYQKAFSTRKNADKALSDAIVLRLGLGHEDQAIQDAKSFQASYGARDPGKTGAIQFAVGAHYVEKGEYDKARSTLQGAMGIIDKAPPDVQLQAHAMLGRALYNIKAFPGAKGEFATVRKIWGEKGTDVVAKINAAYKDEDEASRERRLGKALDAVGEALFHAAEEKKAELVDPLKFPIYAGNGTKEDVLKHIGTKVKEWFQKKLTEAKKVDAEYQKVTELQPLPPPRWVIAAASRAGLMWGTFVDEFRAAPIPTAWKSDPEIRGTYYQNLDAVSEPMKVGNAKPALKRCLDQSVKFQYFDQYSRDCEAWLAKNYKGEYHIVDELRGAPTLSNSGLDDRPPPLVIGGQLWHPPATGPATEKAGSASAPAGDKK